MWSQRKMKRIGHTTIEHTLKIFTKRSMICPRNCPKSWGNEPQQPKILTTDHFLYCLKTLPCRPISQSKIKLIRHGIACDTLIISCNCDISYSLIYTKTWEKRLKRLKILRTDNFSYVWATFPANFDPKRKLKQLGKEL